MQMNKIYVFQVGQKGRHISPEDWFCFFKIEANETTNNFQKEQ